MASRRGARAEWIRPVPLVLAILSAGTLLAGGHLLWQQAWGEPRLFRLPAALMMLAAAAVEAAWARRLAQEPREALRRRAAEWLGSWETWARLALVLVGSYVVCLVVGPQADVRYLFGGLLAVGAALWLAPLVMAAGASQSPWGRAQRRLALWMRAGELASCGLIVVLLLAEGGLRVWEWTCGTSLVAEAALVDRRLPPGLHFAGRQVNADGYWDDEFRAERRPGTFRIAALGDHALLAGTASTNCLTALEQRLPDVELYHFGLPGAGPDDYAAQLAADVVRYAPDLVLTFVSVGDDVAHADAAASAFDWREVRVLRQAARTRGSRAGLAGGCQGYVEPCPDYESFLTRAAVRFTVCRTPVSDEWETRWERTAAALRTVARHGRQRGLEVALVLVPAEFQVSPTLCETVRRRLGCEAHEVDLEFPQRRLTRLADEEQVAVVDLLPYFRAATESPFVRNSSQWNAHGNQIAADALARWLRARRRLVAQTAGAEKSAVEPAPAQSAKAAGPTAAPALPAAQGDELAAGHGAQ